MGSRIDSIGIIRKREQIIFRMNVLYEGHKTKRRKTVKLGCRYFIIKKGAVGDRAVDQEWHHSVGC